MRAIPFVCSHCRVRQELVLPTKDEFLRCPICDHTVPMADEEFIQYAKWSRAIYVQRAFIIVACLVFIPLMIFFHLALRNEIQEKIIRMDDPVQDNPGAEGGQRDEYFADREDEEHGQRRAAYAQHVPQTAADYPPAGTPWARPVGLSSSPVMTVVSDTDVEITYAYGVHVALPETVYRQMLEDAGAGGQDEEGGEGGGGDEGRAGEEEPPPEGEGEGEGEEEEVMIRVTYVDHPELPGRAFGGEPLIEDYGDFQLETPWLPDTDCEGFLDEMYFYVVWYDDERPYPQRHEYFGGEPVPFYGTPNFLIWYRRSDFTPMPEAEAWEGWRQFVIRGGADYYALTEEEKDERLRALGRQGSLPEWAVPTPLPTGQPQSDEFGEGAAGEPEPEATEEPYGEEQVDEAEEEREEMRRRILSQHIANEMRDYLAWRGLIDWSFRNRLPYQSWLMGSSLRLRRQPTIQVWVCPEHVRREFFFYQRCPECNKAPIKVTRRFYFPGAYNWVAERALSWKMYPETEEPALKAREFSDVIRYPVLYSWGLAIFFALLALMFMWNPFRHKRASFVWIFGAPAVIFLLLPVIFLVQQRREHRWDLKLSAQELQSAVWAEEGGGYEPRQRPLSSFIEPFPVHQPMSAGKILTLRAEVLEYGPMPLYIFAGVFIIVFIIHRRTRDLNVIGPLIVLIVVTAMTEQAIRSIYLEQLPGEAPVAAAGAEEGEEGEAEAAEATAINIDMNLDMFHQYAALRSRHNYRTIAQIREEKLHRGLLINGAGFAGLAAGLYILLMEWWSKRRFYF